MTPFYKIYHSYPKINVFLKVVGSKTIEDKGDYALINSRFMLLDEPFDALWFEESNLGKFDVVGDFNCKVEDNLIYKAYRALIDIFPNKKIAEFCRSHRVKVYKRIPAGAGLGGGSSNAATFLKMLNETVDLGLNLEDLATVGQAIGADVPFFVYGYPSANVSGIGEIVEPFEEEKLNFKLFTPPIFCDTAGVYKTFRKHYGSFLEIEKAQMLNEMQSDFILKKFDAFTLNDLFEAALWMYPLLRDHKKDGWFFSGSGSTFFKPTIVQEA